MNETLTRQLVDAIKNLQGAIEAIWEADDAGAPVDRAILAQSEILWDTCSRVRTRCAYLKENQ